MRKIKSNETCYRASEIVDMLLEETGYDLHPSNVGRIAQQLNLDYVEVTVEADPFTKAQCFTHRLYSQEDFPRLFSRLKKYIRSRQRREAKKAEAKAKRKAKEHRNFFLGDYRNIR